MNQHIRISDCDTQVYREMAQAYRQLCQSRPFVNRASAALIIGSRSFGVSVSMLRRHQTKYSVTAVRHKLMAFTRVVSEMEEPVVSFPAIGRAFHRYHTTALYAFNKYGAEIESALQ